MPTATPPSGSSARAGLARELEVLRQVAGARCGAIVLWDHQLRVTWASPAAVAALGGRVPGPTLADAAAAAFRNLARVLPSPGHLSPVGRPRQVRQNPASALVVRFLSVHTRVGPPWLLAELRAPLDGAVQLATLTRAETQVLHLLVRGLSNQEIADALFVSRETARTHVGRILAKLSVGSRGKAAALARAAGLEFAAPEPGATGTKNHPIG